MLNNNDPENQNLPEETQIVIIPTEEAGQRLDRYLSSLLETVSRTGAQQLISEGGVLVNGKTSKPGYALRANDEIEILQIAPRTTLGDLKPQSIPLDIIYDDSDIAVINKSAGMVVHPAPGHVEDTLVNALLARYPEMQEVGEEIRPGIVHRLDKDTSGLIIIAKTSRAHAALTEQMKQHVIIKRYLALVEGLVSLEQGSIDAPIGRDQRHREQMTITVKDSREARTHFRVLKRFSRHTLLILQLETGRTHQIRVHLKAIGHPVVGDPVYGTNDTGHHPAIKRQFLHASQLKFAHPITGIQLELEAPLPADLEKFLSHETVL